MRWSLAAAFALGAVTVLGFAPFWLFPLPLLTLAWLFRRWQAAPSPRAAAGLGYAFGMGLFLAGVSWIYVSLSEFGGMAAPLAALATLLFCAMLALYPALAGYAFARLRTGRAGSDAALAGGTWMLAEWLRGWLFTGFPWLALGYSQAPPSPLAGFAPLLGSYGIGLIVALAAGLLAFAVSVQPTTQPTTVPPRLMLTPRRLAIAAMLVIILVGALLRSVPWTQVIGAPVKIALLQGNVPQSLKWDPKRLGYSLETYVRLAQRQNADLVVLPETAIPLFFDELPRELLFDLTRQAPVMLGIAVHTREQGQINGYTNGAVVVQRKPEGGFAVAAYAKRHLVPFGEYSPPGFAWFFRLARIPMSDFSAGPPQQKALEVAGQRIAANICYEDAFGEELLAALPEATLLVNLSNTAWFGNSLAQPQHLQIAQLRALETGRPMLRATNTGMTAAITPDGKVAALLEPFTSGSLLVEVQGYQGLTPYARYGNTAAVMLALLACVPALRRQAS